jgi:hypothetical protein
VRLPMFNGTDGKWHVYKANFLAYAWYKGFEGILLSGVEVSPAGEKDSAGGVKISLSKDEIIQLSMHVWLLNVRVEYLDT